MNRIFRNTIFYLLIFLVIIGVVSFFNGSNESTDHISYDKFVTQLESGDVNRSRCDLNAEFMKSVVSWNRRKIHNVCSEQ